MIKDSDLAGLIMAATIFGCLAAILIALDGQGNPMADLTERLTERQRRMNRAYGLGLNRAIETYEDELQVVRNELIEKAKDDVQRLSEELLQAVDYYAACCKEHVEPAND